MDVTKVYGIRQPPVDRQDADEWKPPKSRFARNVVIGAAALVVALAVGYRLWVRSTWRALDQAMERLRQEGEPVAAADLARPPVPAADNAAFDLRSAATLLDVTGAAWKDFNSAEFDGLRGEVAKRLVEKVLEPEPHRQALAMVRLARPKRSANWQIPTVSPLISMQLPDLNRQRDVANLCRAAMLDARLRGDHDAAVESLRDILCVGRASATQPGLVSNLCSTGIIAMACYNAEQLVPELKVGGAESSSPPASSSPGARPATPEQVRGMIDELLDEVPFREGLYRGLRDERVMEVDTALAVAEGKVPAAALAASAGVKGIPLIPRPLVYADAKLLLDFNTATLKVAQTSSDWPTFNASAPASPLPPAGPGQGGHVLLRILLPTFGRAVQTHYRCLAERRMTAVALAVKWYEADHDGRPPRALDELVPKYLPAVPADPFATGGKPLQYLSKGETLAVYSVGEDGIDHGGNDVPINPRRKAMGRWERTDGVLFIKPKPETAKPEE